MGFFLSIILLVSAFLRFPYLDYSPPELFGDEIDVGYQSYSLLLTGRDIYNQVLPTYIHSLSEWRAPLLMYATVPSVALLGLNEWGVRVPEAIFGSLASIILICLVYELSKNKRLSLWSGFFLAILPWHIHYSRAAFEVVLMLDLAMLGTTLLLKRKNLLPAIFFSLALYTYSTAILFVPLIVLAILLLKRMFPWRFAVLCFVFCIPLLMSIFTGTASRRFSSINVTNNKDIIDKVFTLRTQSSYPWGKLFYNRPTVIAAEVVNNYLRAFSTDFLFVKGDPDYRQNLQIIGELLPLTSIFLIIGLIWLVLKKYWIVLVWLALAPIPAALTADGANHATRLFWMIPPLAIALGAGFTWVVSITQARYRKLLTGLILLVILGQLIGVAYYYLHIYRILSWRWWNVGYKNVFTQLKTVDAGYKLVFINNSYEPSLERFLFWTKFSPSEFHRLFTTDKPSADIIAGYEGFALGPKYYFGSFTTKSRDLLPDALYITSDRDDGQPSSLVKTLYVSRNALHAPVLYLITK